MLKRSMSIVQIPRSRLLDSQAINYDAGRTATVRLRSSTHPLGAHESRRSAKHSYAGDSTILTLMINKYVISLGLSASVGVRENHVDTGCSCISFQVRERI